MKNIKVNELKGNEIFDCSIYSNEGFKLSDSFVQLDKEKIKQLEKWSIEVLRTESEPLSPEEIKDYKNQKKESSEAPNVVNIEKIFDSDDPVGESYIQEASSIRSTLINRINNSYEKSLQKTVNLLKPLSQGRIERVDEIYKPIRIIFENAWNYPDLLLFKLADSESVEGEEYISKHSLHTAIFSILLCHQLNFPEDRARRVGVAGLVHDVGMFKIPQHLRTITSNLSDEQYQKLEQHPSRGAKVLDQFDRLENPIIRATGEHHEQVDGSGYPAGISGDDMNEFSKIVNLTMTYVAMTQPRKHRSRKKSKESIFEIAREKRERFDNEIITAFLKKVGIYPPGTFLQLDTGHHAMVISANEEEPTKPVLKVITNSEGFMLNQFFELDLTEHNKSIVGVLNRDKMGYTALELA